MQNSILSMWGQYHHLVSGPSPQWMHRLIRAFVLILFLGSSLEVSSQTPSTTYPNISTSSCTSKDLELVAAYLEGSDSCAPAAGNKKLFLKINNKTGSTRTSFAFWGYLHKNNETTAQLIYACVNGVPPNDTTTLETNSTIDYQIGDKLVIKQLFLAWTSASPNQTCAVLAANPNGISPKCGTLDSLVILTPVGADTSTVAATCPSNKGSITVTPKGGKGPYKVVIRQSGTGVDSVSNYTGAKTFSNLTAGTYSVYVFDSRGCSFSINATVQNPTQPAAPTVCKTEPTLCGSSKGIVKITDSAAGYTYFAITDTGTINNSTLATFSLPAGSNPRLFYKNGSAAACISDTTSCPTVNCSLPGIASVEPSSKPGLVSNDIKETAVKKPNILGSGTLESSVTIKAVPNPFGNKVRFMITTQEAGNGVLEIYNIQGQKIKTIFQGYVPAGTNIYDLTVSEKRRAELIYVFRKGTEQFSGKLLQLDKE